MVDEADKAIIEQKQKEIEQISESIIEQEQIEEKLFKIAQAKRKYKAKEEFKEELRALDCPYENDKRSFEHVRSFLVHLGIMKALNDLIPLNVTSESYSDFQRLINFLDSDCRIRKLIRTGVIYVKRGQFDQESILCNMKGSQQYEDFLKELGEQCQLTHKGENLDPEVVCYYKPTFMMLFHVVILMPTEPGDEQQLEKKKYVGNNPVHIVWSENDRNYKAGTITGSFNFAHIIIYPQRNGLFRIQIEKKNKAEINDRDKKLVDFFGPLMTGMLITMDILTPLLRYTAINARKSINHKNLRSLNPISERRKNISSIIKKFVSKSKSQGSLIDFLASCG